MENRLRDRIARVLTSTAHTLVDKIEGLNEEGILEAAIREVDGAVDEVHVAQGESLARKHHVTKAIERLTQERNRLEDEAETALRAGREDLAVAGLARIDDIERQLPELESQMLDHKAEAERLGQSLESLKARRAQMADDLLSLRRTRAQTPSAGGARRARPPSARRTAPRRPSTTATPRPPAPIARPFTRRRRSRPGSAISAPSRATTACRFASSSSRPGSIRPVRPSSLQTTEVAASSSTN